MNLHSIQITQILFNPSTNIDFDIVKDGHTQVVVYDIMGRQIKNLIGENMKAGYHSIALER